MSLLRAHEETELEAKLTRRPPGLPKSKRQTKEAAAAEKLPEALLEFVDDPQKNPAAKRNVSRLKTSLFLC